MSWEERVKVGRGLLDAPIPRQATGSGYNDAPSMGYPQEYGAPHGQQPHHAPSLSHSQSHNSGRSRYVDLDTPNGGQQDHAYGSREPNRDDRAGGRGGGDRERYREPGRGGSDRGGDRYDRYEDRDRHRESDRYGHDSYRRNDKRDDRRDVRDCGRDDRDDRSLRHYSDDEDGPRGSPGRRRRDRPREDRDSDYDRRARRDVRPSKSIIIHGVPNDITEDQIFAALDPLCQVVQLRLPRDGGVGPHRGFAFVELGTVDAAGDVLSKTDGQLRLGDSSCRIEYSHQTGRESAPSQSSRGADWVCAKCGTTNFARRAKCFTCNAARQEGDSTRVSDVPTEILAVYGIPSKVPADAIRRAFNGYARVQDLRILQDGTAFISFVSVQESSWVFEQAKDLDIEGFTPKIKYAKPAGEATNTRGPKAPSDGPISAALEQAQWAASQASAAVPPGGVGFELDASSGFYFNQTTGYYFDQTNQLYYKDGVYYHWDSASNQYKEYVPPAHVDESAPTSAIVVASATTTLAQAAAVPASGDTQLVTAEDQAAAAHAAAVAAEAAAAEIRQAIAIKHQKKKPAALLKQKKISVDLQKWGKRQQEHGPRPGAAAQVPQVEEVPQVESSLQTHQSPEPPAGGVAESGGGWSVVSAPEPAVAPAPAEPVSAGAGAATPGGEFICYICQRKFNTPAQLLKHEQVSKLHKTNLELARQKVAAEEPKEEPGPQYKDRAAERRSMHGTKYKGQPGGMRPKREMDQRDAQRYEKQTYEQPPKPLGEGNKGFKMMQAVGWTGGGLGRDGAGIVDPVEAGFHEKGVGLGFGLQATNPEDRVKASDSYAEAMKKKARARLHSEIEQTGVNDANWSALEHIKQVRHR